MRISFIGLGKLGMPCAEAIQKKGFNVTGYDTQVKTSRYVDIKNSIADTVIDRDIIFIVLSLFIHNFSHLFHSANELIF